MTDNSSVKWKNRMIVISVAVFLLVFFAWCLVKPADTVSVSERRPLAKRPTLQMQTIMNGRFAEQFESYSQDQFPLRETFREIKAYIALKLLGQKDNHGVYSANGYLSKVEYPLNGDSISNAGKHFGRVYEKYLKDKDVNVYFSVIPDKNCFLAAANHYPVMDYEKFAKLSVEQMGFAEYIDIAPRLALEDYYFTDTHWRQEKIVDVAQALLDGMGVTDSVGQMAVADEADKAGRQSLADIAFEEKTLAQPFRGVFAGQFGMKTEGEELHYLDCPLFEECIVYDYETNKAISVYDMEKAAGQDPYEMFLAGPKSLLTIENPRAENERQLVMFRDSFGSSIAPLLIPAYSKITLVDIRYISTEYLGKMVDFDRSDVLFLYSMLVLNNSVTLK